MNQRIARLTILITAVALLTIVMPAVGSQDQQGPSGGKITEKPAAKKASPKSTGSGKSSRATANSEAGVVDRIDGRWWTVGNDFGASEVVFTQSGNNVSGAITYGDGRTGELTGVLSGKKLNFSWSNSAGDRGTGWLELSWANFLGGPWRGLRVRDGSWALRRLEGNWCFAGSRDRIRRVTHDAGGRLTMVTEDGTQEEGHLEGPWIFLAGEFGPLKGDVNYKGTRVDFANGAFWTWCGR